MTCHVLVLTLTSGESIRVFTTTQERHDRFRTFLLEQVAAHDIREFHEEEGTLLEEQAFSPYDDLHDEESDTCPCPACAALRVRH